jgi:hypothetical protein
MHPERGHLSPSKAGVAQEEDHEPILGTDCLGEVVHLLVRQETLLCLECGEAATGNRERHGVWGGHDYTRRPGKGQAA